MEKSKVRLSNVQLKQKILHLQSETAKYKQKVKIYEEQYHYKLLEELTKEKEQLEDRVHYLEDQIKRIEERNKILEEGFREIHVNRQKVIQDFKKETMKSEQFEKENIALKGELALLEEKLRLTSKRLQESLKHHDESNEDN
ncbi:hypothetical protein ACERII_00600 [Evansella sp. AB-rgal1]|uniref:hypothetical protein n=1 Tax=Evansella sp. AB-rgal1 TaxID=3242696 RepID=UPI00359D3E30